MGQRSFIITIVAAIAHAALVDWDTDISGVYVGGDGSVVLARFHGQISVSTTCNISSAGEVNTSSSQTRSFGDWQDRHVRWALADPISGTTKLWTIGLPNQAADPCNVTRDQLPFEIVAMHAASKDEQFLLVSRAGGLYEWESGKQATKLPTATNISALPGTPLVAHLNDRKAGASILVILHDEGKQQQVTEVMVAGSGPASVRKSSFDGCDGHRVRGIYAGDNVHDLYAWAVPGRMNLASAYSMDRLTDGTFSCTEIISTGGPGFVGGSYDGRGSLAMMAQDALYIVGGVNGDPDDLHLGVPKGYAPGNFSTIMYLTRQYMARDTSKIVVV